MVSPVDTELKELIYAASVLNEDSDRLDAVDALKKQRLTRVAAQMLCDFLGVHEHPAIRTVVAQVLGYHHACVHFPEIYAEILRRSQQERDPLALQALVYALRNTEGVFVFLDHAIEAVAIEAVMGVPVTDEGLRALLGGILRDVSGRVARAMCTHLARFDGITESVVACLMAESEPIRDFDQRALLLFDVVPHAPLFDALTDVSGDLERTYQSIWPGIWRREQQRRLLGVFVASVVARGASGALIQLLAERVGLDAHFYNRYIRFVRSLVSRFCAADAQELVVACRRIGAQADRESLSRLSELLVCLAGGEADVTVLVQDTLRHWEQYLPGIQVKAFHASR